MKYKSVEEMNMKNFKNNNLITKEQEEWIDCLKLKIKKELDDAYENNPYVGFVSVNMYISRELVCNVDTKQYFNKIEMIKYDLINLGYSVNFEFTSDMGYVSDSFTMFIEWSV